MLWFALPDRCQVIWIVQRPWQYILDGGLACFDENKLVVDGTIWLSQLIEHFVNEVIEEKLVGLVQ